MLIGKSKPISRKAFVCLGLDGVWGWLGKHYWPPMDTDSFRGLDPPMVWMCSVSGSSRWRRFWGGVNVNLQVEANFAEGFCVLGVRPGFWGVWEDIIDRRWAPMDADSSRADGVGGLGSFCNRHAVRCAKLCGLCRIGADTSF